MRPVREIRLLAADDVVLLRAVLAYLHEARDADAARLRVRLQALIDAVVA